MPENADLPIARLPTLGIRLGRWRETTICIGWSYLGLGFVMAAAAWFLQSQPGNGDLPKLAFTLWIGIAILGFAQECAHALAARWLGGNSRFVVLAAHGAAGQYRIFPGLRQVAVAAAGPLSSIVIAAILLLLLLWLHADSSSEGWYFLTELEFSSDSIAGSVVKGWFWVAMTLACIQLLPIWRCSGRTILDGLTAFVRPDATAVQRDQTTGHIIGWCAFTMVALSLFCAVWEDRQHVPKWPMFAGVGFVLWLSAKRVDPRVLLLDPKDKPIGWLGARRIRQAQVNEIREAVDIAKLDDVLDLVSRGGIEALSDDQRQLLHRASRALKKASDHGDEK
ncbi:MAG: hypothetical protein R3C05_07015 [Pirellulaceae bacterium]